MNFFLFLSLSIIFFTVSCSPPSSYRGRYGYKNIRKYKGANRKRIVRTAKRYIGVKYKYGGTTPSGFDCSGYVMYIYRKSGIDLPRAINKQFYSGRRVSLRRARPGDLVFFNTSGKRISHVGLYVGNNRFIHAPRTGKRVSYSNIKNSYWKKRYIGSISYL